MSDSDPETDENPPDEDPLLSGKPADSAQGGSHVVSPKIVSSFNDNSIIDPDLLFDALEPRHGRK